jgi:hypothetical protein
MQHTQFNFVRLRREVLSVALLILAAVPAQSATMAGGPSKPDPLLDGGPPSGCAAGVDYAAGTDANGNRVVPADVDARPVPVPDSIAVPLARAGPRGRVRPGMGDSAYVSLDGKKLEPLINPKPCR